MEQHAAAPTLTLPRFAEEGTENLCKLIPSLAKRGRVRVGVS